MTRTILNVPDISCAHCERTITNSLRPVEGVSEVAVNIPARQVEVVYDESSVGIERMTEVLEGEDYPVASVETNAA